MTAYTHTFDASVQFPNPFNLCENFLTKNYLNSKTVYCVCVTMLHWAMATITFKWYTHALVVFSIHINQILFSVHMHDQNQQMRNLEWHKDVISWDNIGRIVSYLIFKKNTQQCVSDRDVLLYFHKSHIRHLTPSEKLSLRIWFDTHMNTFGCRIRLEN